MSIDPKSKKRLYKLFKESAKNLKIKQFLNRWYGPKCKDFCEDCVCCQKWRAYEELVKNPFDKND